MMRITLPIAVLGLLILSACSPAAQNEAAIKATIAAANTCDTPADCVDAGGKCPFGCYVFVNSSEVDRIRRLVEGYESTCTYMCVALEGVDCIDNKCQPRYEAPVAN